MSCLSSALQAKHSALSPGGDERRLLESGAVFQVDEKKWISVLAWHMQ
jgi:hypothetical protein